VPAPTIRVDIDGDTAYVTLSRPQTRNALARAVHRELGSAIDEIRSSDALRFIVLAGDGGIFSSGGDLSELESELPADYVDDYWSRMRGTIVALSEIDQIVISKIEGAAIGAGAALALAADIVIAEATAKIRFPFVHLGFVPDAGSTWIVPRNAGFAIARDLLLTGRWVDMSEAQQIGLVSRIVEPNTADAAVSGLLQELRQAPRGALALTKTLINGPERDDMVRAIRSEGSTQPIAASNEDTQSLITQVRKRARSTIS